MQYIFIIDISFLWFVQFENSFHDKSPKIRGYHVRMKNLV
jgi:hypothetical protein